MEKIQIQFKESDYNVYYDYCLKYYRAHDTVRKQSVHAFLDLYEKGIIPVEPEDIRQARRFISGKCEDLKKEHAGTGSEGEPAIPLQVRICSDLLCFCDDLAKMFRLVQKQGVAANYLMILGTFSKVIEENKNSHLSGMYNLDRKLIESLATPLAENIRVRLGTDRNWRSALRELTVIAARFNQRYPEPKFDQDIVLLVGPAVVRHFEKGVETPDILSLIPSCYEESDLDEFESFLNQTPDILRDDENASISWDAISGPLDEVARAVAAQREQWAKEKVKLSDQHAPSLQNGGQSSGAGHVTESLLQANGYRTFDIAVSPDLTSRVETPMTIHPVSETGSAGPAMQPFIPVFIGISVIILFVLVSSIISGAWNPFDAGNSTAINSTGNQSPAMAVNKTGATVTPTIKVTPKPTTTPAKVTVSAIPTAKAYSSADIGYHLIEIAFGPDSSKIQKANKSLVAVSYLGPYKETDVTILNDFIGQFNAYSATTKISTNVNFNSPADITLEFLPGESLNQLNSDLTRASYKNVDSGTIYFIRSEEKTFINTDMSGNVRKRWIQRAILYDLGFSGETAKYSDSLFYTDTSLGNQMSSLDWKAIQLMYGKKITDGMTKAVVKTLVI
ncbi:MAG: hypothetical protein M0Q92_08665 [Methanoregula sp.]|jgi:hypothetical protein|nr:hypothetical protein [Methanoregula sp.]